KAKNFLSFGKDGIEINQFNDFNTIVGPNNSGKTNLLRAFQFVEQAMFYKNDNIDSYHHEFDLSTPFEIELGIKLDKDEISAITNFLICSTCGAAASSPGIELNMLNELKSVIANNAKKLFNSLFNGEIRIKINAGNIGYPIELKFCLNKNNKNIIIESYGNLYIDGSRRPNKGSNILQEIINKINAVSNVLTISEDRSNEYIVQRKQEISQLVSNLNVNWFVSDIGDQDSNRLSIDVPGFRTTSNILKGVESAVREFNSFLLNRSINEEDWNLSKLLGMIYTTSLIHVSDVRLSPTKITNDNDVPYNTNSFNGSELALFLFRLKNSTSLSDRMRYKEIQNKFEDFTDSQFDVVQKLVREPVNTNELEFIPSKELLNTPTIQSPDINLLGVSRRNSIKTYYEIGIHINSRTTSSYSIPLELSYAGSLSILLLLTAVINMADKVILLDEPAQNLHPSKQRELAHFLNEPHGNQIFLITHSPYFVNPKLPDKILRFELTKNGTTIHKLKNTKRQVKNDIIKEMIRSPKIISILFMRKVIFVEGADEEAALPIWIEDCDNTLQLDRKNIQIFDAGGDTRLITHKHIAEDWNIPYRLICDRKTVKKSKDRKNFAKFIKNEEKLGRAYIYPYDDFTEMYPKQILKKYEKQFSNSGWKKNPTIARLIAEESDPPLEIVEKIYPFIKKFVNE
ncbi:MAG: AAA family ATPase, partial [Planctomycetes bacterium]|nr:AAA family ATPase [Planctomycetota bacterium]